MNVCTLYQPGLLDQPAFWIALGAALFLSAFSIKREVPETVEAAET